MQEQDPDWPEIGRELESFWLDQITSSSKIAKKRSLLSLFIAVLRKRFEGLVDTGPLQKLVRHILKADSFRHTPVRFCACVVNVATGEAVYATEDYAGILDYIVASTAIPVEMPTSIIGKAAYVDGGIREVAPLKRAIDEGAREIVCIVCHPERLQGASLNPGSFFALVPRLMDIVLNELVNNDLERFERVNAWVKEYEQFRTELMGTLTQAGLKQEVGATVDEQLSNLFCTQWRHIEMKAIRPENEIVLDLLNFTTEDIREVVSQGRHAARKVLEDGE